MNAAVRSKEEAPARTGTRALSLLSMPLNDVILEVLAEAPKSLVELRRKAGSPSQSTMRLRLRTLVDFNVVGARRQNGFAGALDYELTESGCGLLEVADVLRGWLAAAPEGQLLLGGAPAKSAVKSLLAGWGASMLRALAARPLSLTELDSLIAGFSYPSLERRLTTMRLAGHVERLPAGAGGTPYTVTEWLRRASAPIASAIRWEQQHLPGDAKPVTPRDIEAVFLLAVPLLRLPAELSGQCRLAAQMPGPDGTQLAGVTVGVAEGRIVSCVSRMDEDVPTSASGSVSDWLRAVIEQATGRVGIRGDHQLAEGLLEGLHATLFGAPVVTAP